MNVTVKINGQAFEVEVGDVRARPVLVRIGEEQFEVWPEERQDSSFKIQESKSQIPNPKIQEPKPVTSNAQPATRNPQPVTRNSRTVIAPLPGVIVSLAVKAGAAVAAGQELCALEAMKMKNIIRAPRAGTIGQVAVNEGQTVKHREVLMEYAE